MNYERNTKSGKEEQTKPKKTLKYFGFGITNGGKIGMDVCLKYGLQYSGVPA